MRGLFSLSSRHEGKQLSPFKYPFAAACTEYQTSIIRCNNLTLSALGVNDLFMLISSLIIDMRKPVITHWMNHWVIETGCFTCKEIQNNLVYPDFSYPDTEQPHLSTPQLSRYSTPSFIRTSVTRIQYNLVYPDLSYLDTVQPHISGPQLSGYSTTLFIRTPVIRIQYNLVYHRIKAKLQMCYIFHLPLFPLLQ